MDKGRFTQVERRIEQLVEGSFARLFSGRLHPREVASHLAQALEDNARLGADGILIAPNGFEVHLNPDDLDALSESQPGLSHIIAETVLDLANRGGLRLDSPPTIHLLSDSALARRAVQVSAFHEDKSVRSTQMLEPVHAVSVASERNPRNPQLIVNGLQTIQLTRQVINIGRRHDNHIVIDDQRVSRSHAQLRLRFGRYVLYDLSSSGGTTVNDQVVQECILKPGDVISLAGVSLVYIEDDGSTAHDLDQGPKHDILHSTAKGPKTELDMQPPAGVTIPLESDNEAAL
jgi:Protein of unknown function (DUF3662)/FHA domain